MIKISDKVDCCGCEACVNMCPQKCIVFSFDSEGFGYPEVDNSKCIGCGLCEQVCPMDKKKENNDDLLQCFVGKTQNKDILHKSASGGVFTQIASGFLRNGDIVYGAAYDENFNVRHVRCSKIEQLLALTGSKYVQSRMGDVYARVKKDLSKGKKVLFSGTPCQINGIISFIGNHENLFTLDIVCHAVPSPLIWKKYVKHMDEKYCGKINNYNMRDKIYGYQFSHFVSYDRTGKIVYKGGTFFNQYLRAFFSGICDRPSCYRCRFKTVKRNSDITLGDCFFSNNYGVSDTGGACTIIVHTLKGSKLINDPEITKRSIEVTDVIRGSKEITKSTEEDHRRNDFWEDVRLLPIEKVLNKYFPMSFIVYFKYYLRVALCKMGMHDFIKRTVGRFRNNHT